MTRQHNGQTQLKSESLQTAYDALLQREGLQADSAQQQIVDKLSELQRSLSVKPGGLIAKLGLGGRPDAVTGLYIWGGVGRGKTMLMDLFFQTLDLRQKRRIHFHRIMREVHERLNELDNVDDPLKKIARDLASETRVLCFDEFFVSDIGDAMILGGLLQHLFHERVTLVATSNTAPQNLYANGLQRERFLPAIAALERHCEIVEIGDGEDYRLQAMEKAGTYLTPINDETTAQLEHFFARIAPGAVVESRALNILGRNINTLRCAKGVAWFDFFEICDGPRSQNDYIELARWCQTVIVSGVPVLDAKREDQSRRFVAMVDEFYDRKVKLVLSAETTLERLYSGKRLAFEFERTVSRLTEMQTAEYLHTPHIA